MNEQRMYWGIVCRTCGELVAFDSHPYASFGPAAAGMKPGAIRCREGHNHIYFPRDFRFYPSVIPIQETAMAGNRATYGRINPAGHVA
jgi:hypothetical protein